MAGCSPFGLLLPGHSCAIRAEMCICAVWVAVQDTRILITTSIVLWIDTSFAAYDEQRQVDSTTPSVQFGISGRGWLIMRSEMRAFNGTEPELMQDEPNRFVQATFRLSGLSGMRARPAEGAISSVPVNATDTMLRAGVAARDSRVSHNGIRHEPYISWTIG